MRNCNGSSGDIGFLTCGHGWTDGQSVYATDNTIVGTADVQLYKNMDVTFVKLNDTSLNSRGYMRDGERITKRTSITQYDQSRKVKKYGAKLGIEEGYIKAVSVETGNWNGYKYSNLFLTSCRTQKGDSGGAFVFDDNTIVGLMMGAKLDSAIEPGTSDNPIYKESVALPISDVVSETGFLPAS